jgi:hypothetical protein
MQLFHHAVSDSFLKTSAQVVKSFLTRQDLIYLLVLTSGLAWLAAPLARLAASSRTQDVVLL